MPHKYAIIYPPCHGGNFLGELLTLGEDLYSCHNHLLSSTTAQRLAACTARYTVGGDWINNENNSTFRSVHAQDSTKTDLIQGHIYNIKLSNDFKIIVADAFSNSVGVDWAQSSRHYLFSFSDCYGMHHDEDKHYDILKNSALPMLYVDMTAFLNPVFPLEYYETLCNQLGIAPVTNYACRLHAAWIENRVKHYQPKADIADALQKLWSTRRQQQLQDRYCDRYRTEIESIAANLEETYRRVKGPDWPEYSASENFFKQLPDWIKQECLDFEIDWDELGTVRINRDHAELAVKYGYPVDPYYQYTHIVPNLLFINQHTL